MKSREEYIDILRRNSDVIRHEFGVSSLCLFGSVARGEQHEGSDVDVCVEMPPKMFAVIGLKRFLEDILNSSVDVVRVHKGLNPFLQSEIKRDGIYLI